MKKNILIIGKLPTSESEFNAYTDIIYICKPYSKDISSPIDTAKFKGDDKQRFERAWNKIEESDIIIAEMSEVSTGQGMEIGYAITLNKPIIVIAKKNSKISGLIKGCPVLKSIIYYTNITDVKKDLQKFLKN